jgi:small-conductance mechanosensitive channel
MPVLLVRIGYVAAVIAATVACSVALGVAMRRLGRRAPTVALVTHRVRRPFRLLAASIAAAVGIAVFGDGGRGWSIAGHATAILVIAAAAWLAIAVLYAVEAGALPRVAVDVPDNRRARAVRTQLTMLRRVIAVAIAVIALGVALTTFREVRLVGTSVLASAGVAAAVAAFATNALLGNVIAGLQIAFSGSVRLDDIVVVAGVMDGEWGRIEEITLTYVVVHVWDDRRLVVPTSYFTTKSFENWTHTGSELIGQVLLDVDWVVDVDGVRTRLRELLTASPLWDGRVCVAQVVDAAGGNVQIRALVSATDAPSLWDLRCVVREGLVSWVRDRDAAPRLRAEVGGEQPHPGRPVPAQAGAPRDERVFSGDAASRARGESFSGPDGHERK